MNPPDPTQNQTQREEELGAWLETYLAAQEETNSVPDPESLVHSLDRADQTLELLEAVWNTGQPSDDSVDGGDNTLTAKSLGRFQIERLLGQGGMGNVFLAFDPVLDRRVALKVPHPEYVLSGNTRQRFVREARAAGMMRHPNIVGIYESGETESVCYIAAEYCQGPTLRDWMNDHATVSVPMAAQIVADLAGAIAHAHEKGVIHRDLKPGNIMMEPVSGCPAQASKSTAHELGFVPRIMDFGLARAVKRDEAGEGLTRTGAALGSAEYMAPEQTHSQPDALGPATDVHALGVILYELLSGVSPFRCSTLALSLKAVQSEMPKPLGRIRRDIPTDLQAICFKCLEKDPRHRYVAAADLQEDLRSFLALRPVTARKTPNLVRLTRWARREPAWATLAGVTIVAFIGIVIGLSVHAHSLREHAKVVDQYSTDLSNALADARREKSNAEKSLELSRQHAEEVETLLYIAGVQNAYQAWEQQHVGRVQEILAQQIPLPGQKDRRGLEWHLLHALTREPESRQLGQHDGAATELAVFPDGRRVASVGIDKTLRIWDSQTGVCERVIPMDNSSDEGLFAVAVSPDGQTIATGSDIVQLWNVASGACHMTVAQHDNNVDAIAFSPDGKFLATSTRYAQVQVFTRDGALVSSTNDTSRHITLNYTADGKHLLVPSRADATQPHYLSAWNADLSSVETTYESELLEFNNILAIDCPALDGIWAASEVGTNSIACLLDTHSGRELAVARGSNEGVNTIASSADGRLLAIGFKHGVVRYWYATRNPDDGTVHLSRPHSIHAHVGNVMSVRFLANDQLITAGQDGSIKTWVLPSDANPKQIETANSYRVAYHHASQRVVFTDNHSLHLADRDGEILWSKEYNSNIFDLSMSHDGRFIAVRAMNQPAEIIGAVSGETLYQIPELNLTCAPAFSPTRQEFATVLSTGAIAVFETVSGKQIAQVQLDPQQVNRRDYECEYSPDGEYLVCGGDIGQLFVIDAEDFEIISQHSTPERFCSFAFDPLGRSMVSGHFDGTIRIWDWPGCTLRATMKSPDNNIGSAVITPDGATLITTCVKSIRLFSIKNKQEYGAVYSDGMITNSIALSPDGKTLYAVVLDASDNRSALLIYSIDE